MDGKEHRQVFLSIPAGCRAIACCLDLSCMGQSESHVLLMCHAPVTILMLITWHFGRLECQEKLHSGIRYSGSAA